MDLQSILNSQIVQSNTVNFIIMVIILGAIVKKCNIAGNLDNSIKDKEKEIQLSENENINAKNTLKTVRESYEKLGDEVSQLKKDTKVKIETLKSEINNSSEVALIRIYNNMQNSINAEDAKMSSQITDETLFEAVKVAEESIVKQLENNAELHAKLIEKSIEEIIGAKL